MNDVFEGGTAFAKRLAGAISGCIFLALTFTSAGYAATTDTKAASASPMPLLEKGHPVDWWFVFKFNTKAFPACGGGNSEQRQCAFGGSVQDYKPGYSQQYVYASSEAPTLKKGGGCAGDTTTDPVGATFDEVYNASTAPYFVVWNDQFYGNPSIPGCAQSCSAPWGHSKGMLAWNDDGNGFLLQVTTPSWPGAGNVANSRNPEGNTLGCVTDDDVLVSQHFFALKLTKGDVAQVLAGLGNASVVTDPSNPQIVHTGGPADIQKLVAALGAKSDSTSVIRVQLSTGVGLISKPSKLHVPPWQMVSAVLGGVPLRTATWWANPQIASTKTAGAPACWDDSLPEPGPVQIATSGQWNGQEFGLKGGLGQDFNHAKIGVSTGGENYFSIFGDMNQQGTLSGSNCGSSQNGRGGLFFVIDNQALNESITSLINGETAAAK